MATARHEQPVVPPVVLTLTQEEAAVLQSYIFRECWPRQSRSKDLLNGIFTALDDIGVVSDYADWD